MGQWRGENARPEQKVILVVYFFRFRCRINSQINVTTGAEGVGFTGQPLRIQCHGMLMAGIQFTTGEH